MYHPSILVKRDHPNALLPSKDTPSSIGYNITAIGVSEVINPKTTVFDTGLIINQPNGYYLEIVGNNFLRNSGYVLTNGVEIINPDHTGRILFSLTKIDDTSPVLTVPFTLCQLRLQRNSSSKIEEF